MKIIQWSFLLLFLFVTSGNPRFNPEVHEKPATEAIEASEKEMNSGKISREELSELTYLDNVLSEALRMAAVPIIFK